MKKKKMNKHQSLGRYFRAIPKTQVQVVIDPLEIERRIAAKLAERLKKTKTTRRKKGA